MKDRIKELRKAERKTQEEFAKVIGLSRNFIAQIELGTKTPSERTISDICREFEVNENWLRTGEGEMFIDIPEEDLYSKAAAALLKEDDILGIEGLKLYYGLPAESKAAVKEYVLKLAEMIKEKELE